MMPSIKCSASIILHPIYTWQIEIWKKKRERELWQGCCPPIWLPRSALNAKVRYIDVSYINLLRSFNKRDLSIREIHLLEKESGNCCQNETETSCGKVNNQTHAIKSLSQEKLNIQMIQQCLHGRTGDAKTLSSRNKVNTTLASSAHKADSKLPSLL